MSNTDNKKLLPQIHARRVVAKSGLFKIEQLDLEFSNGETRVFERMAGSGRGAVMVVPFINDDEFLLVREYAAGTHTYELGFPKGLIDLGESPEIAANRELKEEIGFGTEDLYPEVLPGDEPEPLEVVKWSIHNIDALLAKDDFVEARCIAALLLAEKWKRTR